MPDRVGFAEDRPTSRIATRRTTMADYAKDVLVETDWVQEHLEDDSIRIVEVDENPALYDEAHIPGAIGFDWKKDLQDQVKRDFLGPQEFGELMGGRGITNDHQIVLYGDRNNWFAAYTYWYLNYYGHDNVRLMNGPREKWLSENRPTTQDAPSFASTTFQVPGSNDEIRAKRDLVLEALDGDYRLLDVRSPQEFSGERHAFAEEALLLDAVADVAGRQLEDLLDFGRLRRPLVPRLDDADERVDAVARDDRRRRRQRADQLELVGLQSELLVRLAE